LTAVKLGEPQPFDLVIVADHSQSLSWSRDELSSGLKTLLTNVKGRAVRIFLMTPTQYGASSAEAQMPLSGESLVAWKDPATGKAYTNEMTTYVQTCTDPTSGAAITCPNSKGPTPYKKVGTWQFKMPDPIAILSPDMTDAQFAAEQQSVTNAILAISGAGSPREQPLCTLSRYVSQDRATLPTNVVFLIISDEDDISTPAECLAGFTATLEVKKTEASTSACRSACDTYRYSMTGDYPWRVLGIRCAAFDDLGNPIPGTEQTKSLNQHADTCAPGPCTAEESRQAMPFCDQGKTLLSCDRTCSTGETRCTVDLTDGAINPCTQAFTINGTRYNNLAEYCTARAIGTGWRACGGGGLNIEYTEQVTGGLSPNRLMSGTTTTDIIAYFRDKALSVFAGGSQLVEAIIFDPAFSCTLGSGQSYATNLAGLVADRCRLFPLCESYAPALDGVSTFVETLIQSQFPLVLKEDESVTLVAIIGKDGSERSLRDGQFSYNRATQTLTVDRSLIHATDTNLRVEISSGCRPIPQ